MIDFNDEVRTRVTLALFAERGTSRCGRRHRELLERGWLHIYYCTEGRWRWIRDRRTEASYVVRDVNDLCRRVFSEHHGPPARLAIVFRASMPDHRERPFPHHIDGVLYLVPRGTSELRKVA